MTQQKTGNSIRSTVPAGFVLDKNTSNSANIVRKAFLSLFLLFIMCASYAQNISIVSPTGAYYCGSVVTLESSIAPNLSNSIAWVSTGGIKLRAVGGTGNGFYAYSSSTNNRVEAIVSGAGTVRMAIGVQTTIITLTPSPATLTNLTYSSSTNINQANGIQTTKNWICVKNNGTTETITVKNPSPLNIFWVVSGGAIKMGESQAVVGGLFTYTVTVATSGPTAGKGSIRAFVSDPCGTLTCDPALDWEILKDGVPNEIAGPTCLRDNNLEVDPITHIGTVVYSITDEFAGNAVYDWELLQDGVPATAAGFAIRSQVLYGNSATIEYTNVNPSAIGNFSLRVTNRCGGSFTRNITVGPATPNITPANNTYCISNLAGTQYTVTLDPLLTGQKYVVTPQGDVNWTAPVTGNQFTVTFNDAISGAVEVSIVNESDENCGSSTKLIYFNREGTGAATITGQECIENASTAAVTFIADVFGQYTWTVSPALPTGYLISSAGNVLSITPPAGGFGSGAITSRNYTVTAVLKGCSSTQTASFDFEFAPVKPTITNGDTCLGLADVTSYTVTSVGAATYKATVTPNGGSPVVSASTAIGTPFSYTGTSQDATISFTTYSASGCASLPTVINVVARPVVTAITSTNSCINFGQIATITYTATGNADSYQWTRPNGWSQDTDGDLTNNTATYILDENTAGDVCVTPINGTCVGETFCLNVPRNALAITVSRVAFNASVGFLTVSSATGTPLHIEVRYGKDAATVAGCGGASYPTQSTFASPRTSETNLFYLLDNGNYNWTSVRVTDPVTGCTKCVHFETLIDTNSPSTFKIKNGTVKTDLEIKAYPNPVENVLNVKVPSNLEVQSMNLFDPQGKIVFSTKETKNEQKIDVSKFAKGSYILLVVTDKGAETKKIIIE